MLQIDNHDPLITVLSLNRPEKRNALSVELIEEVRDAIGAASRDLTRRVIVIRANGPSFCAGLDLKEASASANAHRSAEAAAQMFLTIATSPLVTIAAAHGTAAGGGAGILAACDFVVAGDDLRIAYPEVHRGLVAALVTTLLRRQLGERAVRELILLGEYVDAASAMELGLVNRVIPNSRLIESTMELAHSACRGAPGAIARTKRLLDSLATRTIEKDLQLALKIHLEARNSAEAAEGMAAFLEKRAPQWGTRDM